MRRVQKIRDWLDELGLAQHAEACLRVGQLVEARKTFERIIELAGSRGIKLIAAPAERLLAETLLTDGELTRAEEHFQCVMADLEQSKAESELALAYAGYHRLLRRLGRVDDARQYLMRALEIFDRLGTLIEPERVRAELSALPAVR